MHRLEVSCAVGLIYIVRHQRVKEESVMYENMKSISVLLYEVKQWVYARKVILLWVL